MTLEQIRIFLAVAERQHVTRAAEALNLTQSAVSSAVAALEARHRVRLFDRVGRRIALTEAGRRFMDTARALLAESEAAELMLADLGQTMQGRLRIWASQTVGSYWLPPRLAALHETHPGVAISLKIGNSAQVARAVAEGTADLGFVEGEVDAPDLLTRVVDRDALALVTRKGHRLATGPAPDRAAYLAQDWVVREPGSGTRAVFEDHLAAMGLRLADLSLAMELPSNEAILAVVAESDYASFLSAGALAAHVPAGISFREVDWTARPERAFSVLIHPRRYRSRAVEALLTRIGDDR
ncbi:LysR family transcriptional regulator [Rhodovulum sulfidophilum]|uniref:LysR family transcriptional regulator n=1 Tax=Rhodovulum visakhapatnamense TaxID=364297 RepID=A0ABS1RHV1_9RHOB|nr:LysR substrate-binding domain-containing protein [Rhodovulum visakhapatnamense]MBL3571199.1 LysR family transcriptional regulator [Rhodovulum visakhapatnamense]MBL3579178.1 LysR family transcriptional regulator [Rhodovulum visakhapatnamense]OLS44505.1 LysR family transcriptional regulator [Rhodovulum sulfidophilum]